MRGKRLRAIAGMSGAQAAAADLARVREAAEPAAAPDEALLESARQVLSACETYFKSCRMYADGHPTRERFLGTLDDKMRAHLGRFGALDVEVTARGINFDGAPLYEVERAEQNLWYPLYRDGIRELTFGDELARDELIAFFRALVALAAMKPDDDSDDGEDDAVTFLWDLDLANISYAAIDTFVGGAAGEAAVAQRMDRIREIVTVGMMKELAQASSTSAKLARDIDVAKRLKSIALSKADLTFLAQENLGALDELPARIDERKVPVFAIPPADRAAFADNIKSEPELLDKFLEALVRALATDGGNPDVEILCLRIEQFFTATVVREEFARAAALRRHAAVVLENRGGKPARPELIARVDVAMSADAVITAVIGALAKQEDDQLAGVYSLVEALPRRAAPALLRSLGEVGERKRRRTVCDTLATWGPSVLDATHAIMASASEELALDLLYLIRKIGTDRAVALLDEGCRHGSPQVRGSALRLFAEVAPRDAVARRLRQALRDKDSVVRGHALDAVVAVAPTGADAWIKDSIHADEFAKLDGTEKARLFFAYAKLGGDKAAPELLDKLGQRNLMMAARIDEERAAAAKALAMIKYEPARAVIEKLAKAKMARSALNEACAEALDIFDRPPEVAPAPAPLRAKNPTEPPVISFKPKGPGHG
ncbi:MAG: HEAT repeat domain-containing protein [Acidobacteriota bacterium]